MTVITLTHCSQGANGGLSRVGGEQESILQQAGDYLDYLNPFNKSQIQPGTSQYETAQSAINEIPYGPTRGALLGRLEGGHLYTYTRIFGGAEALTSGGDTFVSTALLGENPSYVGFQLSHEYFHQLSWGLTGGPGGEWMANRFALASNPVGVQAVRAMELQYPSVVDLYRGLMTQAYGGAP